MADAFGTCVIDFGPAPGATTASVVVQHNVTDNNTTTILPLVSVDAATPDHTADEHIAVAMRLRAGRAVAPSNGKPGTFVIYGAAESGKLWGKWTINWFWL